MSEAATAAPPTAPAPNAAPPAPAAPAAPAPAAAPASTVLSAGAGADWIPEKFRVAKADGSIDEIASARKIEEHRSHLERRLGSGDLPPKTADEYAVTMPEQFKDLDLSKDELFTKFKADAHAAGITQKQFDLVMGRYFGLIPRLAEANKAKSLEEANAALSKMWPEEATRKQALSAGYRAAQAFMPEQYRGDPMLENHPGFIAFAAAVGAEMREDAPPQTGASGSSGPDFVVQAAELRDQLQKMPVNDPRRAALRQQLDALYERRYGSARSRIAPRRAA